MTVNVYSKAQEQEQGSKLWMALICASLCVVMMTFTPLARAQSLIMELDEVRAGMRGTAKTVFSGSRVEEFDIEILGVLENWRPGGDLILVRASGQPIEHTGIAAGMSGSPVYVDGRLIGAIAYAWPFSKEPIAGVTPIGEMLEQGLPLGTGAPEPRRQFEWKDSGVSGGALEAIETPLLVSGFHPSVQGIIETELSRYNMTVAQTGSGNEVSREEELVPGAALAAQFVTGDATASAIGTVTYAEGGRILGFGHGLFQAGAVEIPMSSVYIHAVLPSLSGSVKMGSTSRMVGAIVRDGVAGVVGRVGTLPELIPVSVSVRSGGLEPRKFNFGIMRHSLLTPSFVGWSVSSATLTVGGSAGDMTIGLEYEIELDGPDGETRSLEYRDVLFSTSPAGAIAQAIGDPLRLAIRNRFEKLSARSITCKVSVEHSRRTASIDEIYVSPRHVAAGDSVEVTVRLRPFRGEVRLERFVLRIPGACESEKVKIQVCSAPEMRAWEEEATNRRLPPRDIEQLMSRITSSGGGNRVECVAYVEKEETGIEGESFPSPPGSFSSVVGAAGRTGSVATTHIAVVDAAARETGYVIRGCRTVDLTLDRGKSRRYQ
jgi:hypothetical protein